MITDFISHFGTPFDRFQSMNVQPKFVRPDPLLVHEGNPFLEVFDLREPWGPAQEGNFDPIFQKQTGGGSVRKIAYYLECHVRWRDLV